jgi:Domain of unknown function (DUF1707)
MPDAVDGPSPRDGLRAADTDRERVAELLRCAHGEGRLDLGEYDDRVQRAWAARTYGELERLVADLPAGQERSIRRIPGKEPAPQPERGRSARRTAVAAWLSVSVLNLVIWAVVSVATLELVHPWWIWVAGPWGGVLLAVWITDRVGAGRPPG